MDQQNQAFNNIRKELKRLISEREKENSNLTKTNDLDDQQVSQSNTETNLEIDEHLNSKHADLHTSTSTSYSIDENIQKMRSELQKCCEMFETAGETFESINFNCLKHRIRDLHLSASPTEMDIVMQEKEVDQRLNKLTDIMGHKFRQHPGEFGDIPELSNFFKACSQLQHGLEELKHHRTEMDGLGKRISNATSASRLRIEEIQKTLRK